MLVAIKLEYVTSLYFAVAFIVVQHLIEVVMTSMLIIIIMNKFSEVYLVRLIVIHSISTLSIITIKYVDVHIAHGSELLVSSEYIDVVLPIAIC